MQENPLVSIIIPTYNYAYFVSETLQSIQQQTYNNWEAIVVDDGSTDNTKDIVSSFINSDSRIKYIYQTNKGLPVARNTGLKACVGEYIQFLDADDLLSGCKIEVQVNYMLGNPATDISYTYAYYFKDSDNNFFYSDINLGEKAWMPKLNGSDEIVLEKLIEFNIMPVNSALIKRNLLGTIGYQNEDLKCLEDWEYWLRCAFGGAVFNFIEEENAYALIRIHSSSMSQKKINMLTIELKIRSCVFNLIGISNLSSKVKKVLYHINHLHKKKLCRLLLVEGGILNIPNIILIYSQISFFRFATIYIKAINDVRKTRGS